MTAVIIEDERNSREILRDYLSKYCPEVEILGEAATIAAGSKLIRDHNPKLVFLDVEMPFGNAFDLLDQFPAAEFETVFVTAYDHYAKDALNAQAAYYLTKPLNIDELIKAVAHVKDLFAKEEALSGKMLKAQFPKAEGKITLPQQNGFLVINIEDILFCKADDNYTEIYVSDKCHLVSKTLKYFETSLAEFAFARIHKSYLVNVNEIIRYNKGKGGSILLTSGKELPVAAARKRELLAYFE